MNPLFKYKGLNFMKEKIWYVYIIRCKDNSLYTGITIDPKRREKEHISRSKKCAKYTLTHEAEKMEALWRTKDRKNASKLEYYIKTLKKNQKEELIDGKKLKDFLSKKVDCRKYKKVCLEEEF